LLHYLTDSLGKLTNGVSRSSSTHVSELPQCPRSSSALLAQRSSSSSSSSSTL